MRGNRGGNRVNLGVLLLAYQLMSVGFEHIPPVTLIAILGQIAIFLGFIPHLDPYHATHKYCIQADRIWYWKEWWRLMPGVIMHASDMHLYFNMVSLLWKGRKLENRVGSPYFAYLLVVFSALCSVTMVFISVLLEDVLQIKGFYLMHQCAVGFSGVLFALKVLMNHYYPYEEGRLMGWIPVASRWACWAELLLIQVMVPQASFIGHLAGILVGSAYVFGPLKSLMDIFMLPEGEYARQRRPASQPRFRGGGEATGYAQVPHGYESQTEQSHGRYNEYTGGLSEQEQVRRAMQESARETGRRRQQPTAPPYPHIDPAPNQLYPDIGFR